MHTLYKVQIDHNQVHTKNLVKPTCEGFTTVLIVFNFLFYFGSSYDGCTCFVIAVFVLHCAFVRHVRSRSEALCCLFQ